MKIQSIWLLVITLAMVCPAQQTTKSEPCDKNVTFCWYGDEVEAWGDRWVSQDVSEKPLEVSAEIRCVKKLGVCLYAGSQVALGTRVTKVDILPITRWDSQQITADGENAAVEPCDRNNYIVNRQDQTVLLISSPGPKGNESVCTSFMGKPKTVVYKLTSGNKGISPSGRK